VFVTNPAQNEGALHVARQRIISNKSLLQNASRAGLPPFIQAKPFTFKSWQPPNFHVIATPRHPKPDETRRLDVEDTRTKDDMKMLDNNELPQRPESKSHVAPVEATEPLPDLASGTPLPKVPTAHPQADITMQDTNANPGRPTEDKKPKKKNKKKRQQDEQDSHSLGDKVIHMLCVVSSLCRTDHISPHRQSLMLRKQSLERPTSQEAVKRLSR
jgi:endoribonuclease Dicer